jgi:hypothetical protein
MLKPSQPNAQQQFQQVELPIELFIQMLRKIDRHSLLSARRVSRSWFQFISNFQQVLLVPHVQQYIQERLASQRVHNVRGLAALNLEQLQYVASQITQKVKPYRQLMHRAQSTMTNQLRAEILIAIILATLKDTADVMGITFISQFRRRNIFRNVAIVTIATCLFFAYSHYLGNRVYELKKASGIETVHESEMRNAPYNLARLVGNLFVTGLVVFTIVFFCMQFSWELYQNIRLSKQRYAQALVDDIEQPPLLAIHPVTNVSMPVELQTIRWERSLFAPPRSVATAAPEHGVATEQDGQSLRRRTIQSSQQPETLEKIEATTERMQESLLSRSSAGI